jgi:predicted amidohydrolase YtcJ
MKMHMTRKGWAIILVAVALIALAMMATSVSAAPKAADMVLWNGKVVTVDTPFSIAQAVAVRDGMIVKVGTNAQVQQLIGPDTEVIDLEGKELLPGINDSHTHTSGLGMVLPPMQLDLYYPTARTVADIQAQVAARAAELDVAGDPTGWIRGRGWNESLLEDVPEGVLNYLRASMLDVGAHPVYFTDYSGHACWVNSAVLTLAGVTKDSPVPTGGKMELDELGNPTGVFREGATSLVSGVVPPRTEEEQKQSLLGGIHEMNKNGITSITQGGLAPGSLAVAYYRELAEEGQLNARLSVPLSFGSDWPRLKTLFDEYLKTPITDNDPNWLQFTSVKIFADGIPPFKTAWMWTPYTDAVGGGYGTMTIPGLNDDEKYYKLTQMIAYIHGKGYQVHIHTTGSRTTSSCLDGFELGRKLYPWVKDTRDVLVHNEFVGVTKILGISDGANDIRRMAKLGIVSTMQPCILALNADLGKIVGPDIYAYDWPFRSVLDGRAMLTFSSDSPAGTLHPDWRMGVESAVTRVGFDGNVMGPDECITREEAIRCYTINGAWQSHMQKVKGSIEVGKFADFCVLDGDILTCPADEISDIPVSMTIVGGRIVYDPANGIN